LFSSFAVDLTQRMSSASSMAFENAETMPPHRDTPTTRSREKQRQQTRTFRESA